jgi:hypothetical protein
MRLNDVDFIHGAQIAVRCRSLVSDMQTNTLRSFRYVTRVIVFVGCLLCLHRGWMLRRTLEPKLEETEERCAESLIICTLQQIC